MRSPVRAIASAGLAVVLLLPFAGSASAQSAAGLRAAATAGVRYPSVIDAEMQVDDLDGPRVRVRTRADARTRERCDGCAAAAVAVHVVLVDGPVETLQADNAANAMTRGVNSSTTAIAYQIVVAGAGEVDLSRQGRAQLRAIDRRIERLDVDDDLEADVAAAVADIVAVLEASLEFEEPDGDGFRAFSARPDIQVLSDIKHG